MPRPLPQFGQGEIWLVVQVDASMGNTGPAFDFGFGCVPREGTWANCWNVESNMRDLETTTLGFQL